MTGTKDVILQLQTIILIFERYKLAKEMERRNEEAQETCMPLIMKMEDESEDVCRFRRWQLNEIMERGKNFSCFEDLKNTLFEKYENYTMMMSKYCR